jgi:N-methylhydantoinase A/oxoprolinase/acetone carboxylase beta subunit
VPTTLLIASCLQSRPNIFDLRIATPDNLYERVVEVEEAVMLPLGTEANARNGAAAADNPK